jgi:hypothetical protein
MFVKVIVKVEVRVRVKGMSVSLSLEIGHWGMSRFEDRVRGRDETGRERGEVGFRRTFGKLKRMNGR